MITELELMSCLRSGTAGRTCKCLVSLFFSLRERETNVDLPVFLFFLTMQPAEF